MAFFPLENEMGLKALAWDFERRCFVSPSQPDWEWHEGGLVASACALGRQHPHVPDPDCSCGIHIAYDLEIVECYQYQSTISPIFLVEGSGWISNYTRGFRAAEATLRGVIADKQDSRQLLCARQAGMYYRIPVLEEDAALTALDLWNLSLLGSDDYQPRMPAIQGMSAMDAKLLVDQFLTPMFVQG